MIPISLPEAVVGNILRFGVKTVLGPPFPVKVQRAWMDVMSALSLPPRGIRRMKLDLAGVPTVAFVPAGSIADNPGDPDDAAHRPVVLYLHGGAFILGSHRTHAGLAGYIAMQLDAVVYLPNYRLAPEHPWPAGRDDALTVYHALLARGVRPEQIIVAGDSAGGVMTIDLLLGLVGTASQGGEMPAGGVLLSPAVSLDQERPHGIGLKDTLVRPEWGSTASAWYARPSDAANRILGRDFAGLPPIYLQYSDEELLAAENRQLAEELRAAGLNPEVHVDAGPFHVLALLPGLMRRARIAVADISTFSKQSIAAAARRPAPPTRRSASAGSDGA